MASEGRYEGTRGVYDVMIIHLGQFVSIVTNGCKIESRITMYISPYPDHVRLQEDKLLECKNRKTKCEKLDL